MLKQIALLATAFILLGCASANADTKNSAGTQTAYTTQNTQKTSAKELSHVEAIRIGSLIHSMGECVKEMLSDSCTDIYAYREMYINAGKQMASYSRCDIPMNEEDLKIFTDTFYDYATAGNASMTKEDIRADLSRFKTIGEVAAYLSSAMLAGFESE